MGDEIIALDIGGTNTRIAVVKNNKITKYKKLPTPKTRKEFLDTITNLISQFISKKTKGIGIGIPSPVKKGIVKNAPNITLRNFDLKRYLEKKFKKRVEIKNDAACVALAEARLGCKKKNFFIMTLGTGIGGGIIIDGKEYRGEGYGAEFGHIYIKGKQFEEWWKATRRKIKKLHKKEGLIKEIVKRKDKESKKILYEASDYLGQGIASLIDILDPEIIIMAGGIRDAGEVFLREVRKKVNLYSFLPKKTPIKWSKLEHPGILGASLLIK